MDRFSQILYDLGKQLQIELYPDQNRICQINYHDVLDIQIQYLEPKEQILIATFVCEVPPGKYREKLFKEALIANNDYPRVGTLSYTERNNQLTLFENVPAASLTGEEFHKIFEAFASNALLWKDSIESGKTLPTTEKIKPDDGIFGLKP